MIRLIARAQRLHRMVQPRQAWTCSALSGCFRTSVTTFRMSWSLNTLHEQMIMPAYCHVWFGRFTTIGIDVLLTTTHRKGSESEGLISMCGKKAGTWMKSPAFARATYSPRAPQRISQTPDKT